MKKNQIIFLVMLLFGKAKKNLVLVKLQDVFSLHEKRNLVFSLTRKKRKNLRNSIFLKPFFCKK